MKQLSLLQVKKVTGGVLDGVSCECWQMIGMMGFLVGYGDVKMEFGLGHVSLACTQEEQDIAIKLASLPYFRAT